MATIRQSDLSSFSYCALRQQYDRQAVAQGVELKRLSRTIYGTVIHYALQVMQQHICDGRDDALDVALATFEYYWHPDHTAEISEGAPNVWAHGDTWSGMLANAKQAISQAYEWMARGAGSKDAVLGAEVSFDIDFELDGEWHVFHGTIDRLALVRKAGLGIILSVDDFKSGYKPDHLQYAVQWSVYGWATTKVQFWNQFLEVDGFQEIEDRVQARGYDLYETGLRPLLPRQGRWLAVKGGEFKVHQCGMRNEQHYARVMGLVRQYLKAQKFEVYPFTTDTKKCVNCTWRDTCGDAPLPSYQEGVEDAYTSRPAS